MPTEARIGPSLTASFGEPLLSLHTKPFDYYAALSKQGGAPAAAIAAAAAVRPDFLAELSFHRGAVSAWLQPPPPSSGSGAAAAAAAAKAAVPAAVLEGMSSLAARLHGLMDAVAAGPAGVMTGALRSDAAAAASTGVAGSVAYSAAAASAATSGAVRSEWTSPMSNRPQRMLRLDSLPQELAMVYSAYASALRHSAHQRVAEATGVDASAASAGGAGTPAAAEPEATTASSATDTGDGGGAAAASAVAALTAAVGSLRRAAGVYGYLAEELLPEFGGAAVAAGDRPLELLPAAARCMQQLCLAEAQALMAAAAAARGMSPGTQRALHGGCVTLFRSAEDAARELSTSAPPSLQPSDRLPRLLAAAAALHGARCQQLLALEKQRDMELGEAEASCEECQRLLEVGLRRLDRSDPPACAETFKAQQAACAQLLAAVHKDRLSVTYQSLPKQLPDATSNAAVRVAADVFQPAPVMPPVPTPEPGGKGGCLVM